MLFLLTLRPKMKACEICSNPSAVHPPLWLVASASIQGTGERAGKCMSWVLSPGPAPAIDCRILSPDMSAHIPGGSLS